MPMSTNTPASNNGNNMNTSDMSTGSMMFSPQEASSSILSSSSTPMLGNNLTTNNTNNSMMSGNTPQQHQQTTPGGTTATATHWTCDTIRHELRRAISILSQRGLKLASKWASEQLIGLPSISANTTTTNTTPEASQLLFDMAMIQPMVEDHALHAKTLLDLGEYTHAAATLSQPSQDITLVSPPLENLSSFGIYIRAYALYMAGERRKEEELVELREPLERTTVRNAYVTQLCEELLEAYQSKSLDAFGLYVYGMILKEAQQSRLPTATSSFNGGSDGNHNKNTTTSTTTTFPHENYNDTEETLLDKPQQPLPHVMFMESLLEFPWNWSAWLDLADLCLDDPTLHEIVEDKLQPLASHYMYHFFCAHVFGENQAHENSIAVMDKLLHAPIMVSATSEGGTTGSMEGGTTPIVVEDHGGLFFQSPYLASRMAVAHYHLREFEIAQECFVALRDRDPYRLEDLDVYSNILYVQENRIALSQLAHCASKVDKYRPETCCIVGNYYSLKTQRAKAVQYFQRALKLDRNYLSAWTLMGHEYVEMKNTAAAMEAYRRAVDVNERDYRAWYGLGQTYEFLNMHLYALFYYRKAAALRPYDARMWCAMAGCYLGLDRREDAIRAYERAVSHHDTEGIATQKLASLYRQDGNEEKAARCYLRHLELRHVATTPNRPQGESVHLDAVINGVVVQGPEAEALLFLASYHKNHGEYETAAMCCSRLLEYPGPEKEEGKALLREIRSRQSTTTTDSSRPTTSSSTRQNLSTSHRLEEQQQQHPMSPEDDSMMESRGGAQDESSFEFSP